MKNKKLLKSLELADDKYIAEADPNAQKERKKINVYKWGAIAACICLVVVAFNLWLFLPYDNTPEPLAKEYEDSEYYDIIVKLKAVSYSSSGYKNNFEKYFLGGLGNLFGGALKGDAVADDMMNMAPGMGMGSADMEMSGGASADGAPNRGDVVTDKYEEVTDNQVAGIIEADRIKRSDKHIFYLDENVLKIYTIDKENSALVGEHKIMGASKTYGYTYEWEFYLSADCKTVTFVAPGYDGDRSNCVDVISIDVSDPSNIKETGRVTFNGSYLSSRMTDGKLLVITNFRVKNNPDFSDESQFVPQYDCGTGAVSIPAKDIVCPDKLTTAAYAVVYKLDEKTLGVEGASAFLSYSQNVYVSDSAAYLTRTFSENTKTGDRTSIQKSKTEISVLAYKNEFAVKGSVTVDGYVKNQYSLDEYEGILRVVTTTDTTEVVDHGDYSSAAVGRSNADLYCINLADMSIRAKVISFAPAGEIVQSVRFDKTAAYVCTSVQLSDPVFFFDLSDLDNITWKDTGTIDGFSSSLVNFGDGYLLGIGQGDSWSTFKIEVYEESESGVKSVCKYEVKDSYYSTDYKSYYIDRTNKLVGLGLEQKYENTYVVVFFDGEALRELIDTPLEGDNSYKRGVYIDGYFYMFGRDDFKVKPLS